jgi:uridine phosphorylase
MQLPGPESIAMTYAHHLSLNSDDIRGATIALLPGDPGRVATIAEHLDNSVELAHSREFRTHLGQLGDSPILVTSTGCGGPSLSVAVEELAQIGVRKFLRIGSTGGLQPLVKVGDVVISTAAVRRDGASRDFAPLEYPAVGDFWMTRALIDAAHEAGAPYHAGITLSTDTFYPGQERYDTFSGYVPRRLQGSLEEWKALNVLNCEMEVATLFTMTAALGLAAGAICGVVAQRTESDHIVGKEAFAKAIERSIAIAVAATQKLL